jgi:WD40 repeat protein
VATSELSEFYVTGGTLRADAPSYVLRDADRELLAALVEGQYCYVLTSRQMGKSSLMARAASLLRDSGTTAVILDLTALGQNLTPEQWYEGLLVRLGRGIDLEDELDDFWDDHDSLGPMQRWVAALEQVVLAQTDGPVVIFVDEIDVVQSLPFSTNEFFAGIRECFTRRTENDLFGRLAFCLIGVATPSDLIDDVRVTPFNVGQRIELADLREEDALPLAGGLGRDDEHARGLLRRVFYWTNGHPYLTQRLSQAVALDQSVTDARGVDRVCSELFFSERAHEQDPNLQFVRNQMLGRDAVDIVGVLALYGGVLAQRSLPHDGTNPLADLLELAGVVAVSDGQMSVRNRIYARVFDRAWILDNMPDAEARRQKAAYRKGILRATAIATVVVVAIGAVAAFSLHQQTRIQGLLTQATWNLAQSEMDRGVDLLESGSAVGLLHLAEAVATSAEIPMRFDQTAGLWAGWEQDFDGLLLHVLGHDEGVTDVAFSSDDGYLVTTSYDKSLRVWDARTGEPVGEPHVYRDPVRSVSLGPQGLLVVGTSRASIEILNGPNADGVVSPVTSLRHDGPRRGVPNVAVSQDGRFIAAVARNTLQIWDASTLRTVVVQQLDGELSDVCFSPDGSRAVCTEPDGALWVCTFSPDGSDVQSRKARSGVSSSNIYMRTAFVPSNDRVTARVAADTIRLYDLDADAFATPEFSAPQPIMGVAVSYDGSMLAIGAADGTVMVHDRVSGRLVREFPRHLGAVRAVAFSHDGALLASASMDGAVRVWRLAPVSRDRVSVSPQQQRYRTAMTEGADRIALASEAAPITIGHRNTEDRLESSVVVRTPVALATDRSGSAVAAMTEDGVLTVWMPDTGVETRLDTETSGWDEQLAFAPDGSHLVAARNTTAGAILHIWDTDSFGHRTVDLGATLYSVAISSDSSAVAAGTYGDTAWVGDFQTPTVFTMELAHTRAVEAVALSSDGVLVATGSRDQLARLWRAHDGAIVGEPMQHDRPITALAFSPDDTLLATGTVGGVVRLWSVATQRPMSDELHHGDDVVGAVVFSTSGRYMATLSQSSLRVWHVEMGRPYGRAMQHGGAVSAGAISFTRDEAALIAVSSEGHVTRWPIAAVPGSLEELRLRTWAALGIRLDEQGAASPIPWQEWRDLRDRLDQTALTQ